MGELGFLDELLRSPHQDVWLQPDFAISDGETSLDDTWGLVTVGHCAPTIAAARQDLEIFLSTSMRVVLQRGADRALVLGMWPDVETSMPPETVPEAYVIEVLHDRVLISGSDEAGVLYGVYALEQMMKFRGGPALIRGVYPASPIFRTRIYRSPLARYYDDEMLTAREAYPEAVLRRLSLDGFNGIWLRSRFRDLSRTSVFPEFGAGSEVRIALLNDLIDRCAVYNIGVFIYLMEPLGLKETDPFFSAHPEVRGSRYEMPEGWGGSSVWGGAECALCSSTPEVRRFLEESTHNVIAGAPGLGGLILVTASEQHHHCYSHIDLTGAQHGDPQFSRRHMCPRCAQRSPADVVSEIINTVCRMARAADPSIEVIAWNWAWSQYEADPQFELISRIDPEVTWMGGFEAGAHLNVQGSQLVNEEYSLSLVGPSERFRDSCATARGMGHPVYAKVQIGTTHEDAVIPYLPVMTKVEEKFRRMADLGVDGYMACWNFGNFVSPVTELAGFLSWRSSFSDSDDILRSVAARDYGEDAVEKVMHAWGLFAIATDHYPLCLFFLGLGIHTRAPAYPLHLYPAGRPTPLNWRSVPREDWGDDHSFWTGKLGTDTIVSSLMQMLTIWKSGVDILAETLDGTNASHCRTRLERHLGIAKLFYHQMKSTCNFLDFTTARDRLLFASDKPDAIALADRLESIAREELEHCEQVLPLLRRDAQLGFHGEAFEYLLDLDSIELKKQMLDRLIATDLVVLRASLAGGSASH